MSLLTGYITATFFRFLVMQSSIFSVSFPRTEDTVVQPVRETCIGDQHTLKMAHAEEAGNKPIREWTTLSSSESIGTPSCRRLMCASWAEKLTSRLNRRLRPSSFTLISLAILKTADICVRAEFISSGRPSSDKSKRMREICRRQCNVSAEFGI